MILILENLEGLWRKFLSQGQKVSFLPYHAHSFPRNLNDPPKDWPHECGCEKTTHNPHGSPGWLVPTPTGCYSYSLLGWFLLKYWLIYFYLCATLWLTGLFSPMFAHSTKMTSTSCKDISISLHMNFLNLIYFAFFYILLWNSNGFFKVRKVSHMRWVVHEN